MRAPPVELKTMAGIRRSYARSKTRATFSPTTEPIEPPMNSKAKLPIETALPSIAPTPETNASARPVFLAVLFSRSRYLLESTKPSGSWGTRSASSSSKLPGSSTISRRRRTGRASWWPHSGHTFQWRSHSSA
jgi:hypothetical protein